MDVPHRYALWVEAVRAWCDHPGPSFPRSEVTGLIAESFESAHVAWNWRDPDSSFGFEQDRDVEGLSLSDPAVVNLILQLQSTHPLLVWFACSHDPLAMSIERIPHGVVSESGYGSLRDLLRPSGLQQQLSIPYRLGDAHYRAFVMARAGRDFTDQELDLARRIQPLLALLERQVSVTSGKRRSAAAAVGLTGRETAVLQLLSEGRTADAIARRLGISPRTVHNHLANIYRKLDVADRMRAVLIAQALGLIDTPHPSRTRIDTESRPEPRTHNEITTQGVAAPEVRLAASLASGVEVTTRGFTYMKRPRFSAVPIRGAALG
jgi:DNA-binding CsgD family transcriptional regulator